MGSITYEQFVAWCKHWNYTIEEGFRAMCFSANIVGQYFGNCNDYAKEITNSNHSDAFKCIASTIREDAILLSTLYNKLESEVFTMLEKNEGKV
jgi:hypothetical protein